MIDSIYYDDWLNAQIAKANSRKRYPKAFVGERPYLHFDPLLYFPRAGKDVSQEAKLKELLNSDEQFKQHGFLPFILNGIRTRKFMPRPIVIEDGQERNQKSFPHIKSRPTMYASHKDSCIFSFYSHVLGQKYEAELARLGLSENVIAYRSIEHKNNIDFAKAAFERMADLSSFDCIMVDIKGFFDHIDHDLLYARWNKILDGKIAIRNDHLRIFKEITSYRYIDNKLVIETLKANKRPYLVTERGCKKMCALTDYNKYIKKLVKTNNKPSGIPQGSPISGTLANMYMLDFDSAMKNEVEVKYDGLYQRYSDDILIVVPNGQAKPVYDVVVRYIAKEKLRLSIKKTEAFRREIGSTDLINITDKIEPKGNDHRDSPQYLGFHFDGSSIVLRPSTIGKHFRKPANFSYMSSAMRKVRQSRITKQINKMRSKIKNR